MVKFTEEPIGNFYKALIQFAGAFVHMQKERRGPAVALLKLSAGYMKGYGSRCCGLDVEKLMELGAEWETALNGTKPGPLIELCPCPKLLPLLEAA